MRCVALLVLVGAALLPCTAAASRSPTSIERTALDRTVIKYIDTAQDHCCAKGLHAKVIAIRVSTVDPTWALVGTAIRTASGQQGQGADLVMHRVRSTWLVTDLGTAVLGCGVSKAVRTDLRLTCPTAVTTPTPAAASRAFGRWLHNRYGNVQGYWVCPQAQVIGNEAGCTAEVHVGQTRHLTWATATLASGQIVFLKISDQTWVREWSPFSRRILSHGGFNTPGELSVNSPAFDWAFIATQAYRGHHTFSVAGLDGDNAGLMKFFAFKCSAEQNRISCTNAFGDAMRYIPA